MDTKSSSVILYKVVPSISLKCDMSMSSAFSSLSFATEIIQHKMSSDAHCLTDFVVHSVLKLSLDINEKTNVLLTAVHSSELSLCSHEFVSSLAHEYGGM
jgi:hypothetical protein